jgi:recombination protein RecR
MSEINRLAQYFAKFPGIGERQAKRFVYFLLNSSPAFIKELTGLLNSVRENTRQCPDCHIFHHDAGSRLCVTCKDPNTDLEYLMVLEKDIDQENMRKTGSYLGKYFILGGLIPAAEKEIERSVRLKELSGAIEEQVKNGLKEIILAFSITPHGEYTEIYLRNYLLPLKEKHGFRISSLGRGLSTGTELEYSDNKTLENALKNRN